MDNNNANMAPTLLVSLLDLYQASTVTLTSKSIEQLINQ